MAESKYTELFRFEADGMPEDTFHVLSFRGTEALSSLFSFDVELVAYYARANLLTAEGVEVVLASARRRDFLRSQALAGDNARGKAGAGRQVPGAVTPGTEHLALLGLGPAGLHKRGTHTEFAECTHTGAVSRGCIVGVAAVEHADGAWIEALLARPRACGFGNVHKARAFAEVAAVGPVGDNVLVRKGVKRKGDGGQAEGTRELIVRGALGGTHKGGVEVHEQGLLGNGPRAHRGEKCAIHPARETERHGRKVAEQRLEGFELTRGLV